MPGSDLEYCLAYQRDISTAEKRFWHGVVTLEDQWRIISTAWRWRYYALYQWRCRARAAWLRKHGLQRIHHAGFRW